jgi:hypothetical protein
MPTDFAPRPPRPLATLAPRRLLLATLSPRGPLLLAVLALAAGCARPRPTPRTALDDQPPRMVSAFFGLDHAMPEQSRLLCRQGPGQDGIPVTFSRRVVGEIKPDSFSVRLRSGQIRHPICATTAPANAAAENHTVLLVGDLGREPADPPLSVEMTGPLSMEGGVDGKGLTVPMTPLVAGPTMVLALGLEAGAIASDCPKATRQIVVVVWAGGVVPGPGSSEASHLAGYRVTTAAGEARPAALGDLGDHDNYIHLCLETTAPAQRVSFPAGIVVDPRGDLNPDTTVEVSPGR